MTAACRYCEQCGDCVVCDNPHRCTFDVDARMPDIEIQLQARTLGDNVFRWRAIEKAASQLAMHGRTEGDRGTAPMSYWNALFEALSSKHATPCKVVPGDGTHCILEFGHDGGHVLGV